MVEWRSRGYVQDSDEGDSISDDEYHDAEEEKTSELAQGLQSNEGDRSIAADGSSGQATDAAKGVLVNNGAIHDFEDIDELQLDNHHEALASFESAQSRLNSKLEATKSQDIFDIPSSPPEEPPQPTSPILHSTSSSALSSIPSFAASPSPTQQPTATLNIPRVVITPHEPSHEPQFNAGRTFRQRNPIQLHPYLLENETYRQSLRARGLRPVQVTREELRPQAEALDETQWQDGSEHGSDSDRELAFSSSQPSVLSQQPPASAPQYFDDEELPSLQDLLTRRVENGVQKGFKRLKTMHQLDRSNEHRKEGDIVLRLDTPEGKITHEGHTQDLISPLTETRHHKHKLSRVRPKKFKYLPAYEPAHLLTPGPSSDSGKARIDAITIDSVSQMEPFPESRSLTRSRSVKTTRSRSPEPAAAVSQAQHQVKKATKRIKGVLPASWLRIDQQAQHRKPVSTAQTIRGISPRKREGEPGVARRVTSSRRDSVRGDLDAQARILVQGSDDESASDVETTEEQLPAASLSPSLGYVMPEIREVEVDDWVDPMLPTASRRPHTKAKKRRQMGLEDAFARSNNVKTQNRTHHGLHGDRRSNASATAPRTHGSYRHRSSQKRYSIVDAVRRTPSAPDFIRVATRRAQKRKDKGRHSPTSKQISFHRPQDTRETQHNLGDWRRGRIHKRLSEDRISTGPSHRQPLTEHSGNQQTRFPSPVKLSRSGLVTDSYLANERLQNEATPTNKQNNKKKRQSRLDLLPISQPNATRKPDAARVHAVNASSSARKVARRLKDVLFAHPGQLQSFQQGPEDRHDAQAFSETLNNLDDDFDRRERYQQRTANPLLQRYLDPEPNTVRDRKEESSLRPSIHEPTRLISSKDGHRSKPRPQPLTVREGGLATLEFENHFPSETASRESQNDDKTPHTGFHSSNTVYSIDFDAKHLPDCVFFHQSTFLGSCEFQAALEAGRRDLEQQYPPTEVSHCGHTYRWGAWNEDVLSQLTGVLLDGGMGEAEGRAVSDGTRRSITAYFAKSLSFSDDLDRPRCVQQMNTLLKALLDVDLQKGSNSDRSQEQPSLVSTESDRWVFLAVLAFQICQIAGARNIGSEIAQVSEVMFVTSIKKLVVLSICAGIQQIDAFLDTVRRRTDDVYCIRGDQPAVEVLVIAHHLLRVADRSHRQIWEFISEALSAGEPRDYTGVMAFEGQWSVVFAVMPLLEIDSRGIVSRKRHCTPGGGWTIVKPLVSRLYDLYKATTKVHSPNMNSYVRATMSRCFVLITTWGWNDGEIVLSAMFDFFAHEGFSFLEREDSRGSPSFLEKLDRCEDLIIEPSDRSFDIFLKTIATVLRKMRSACSDKKTKNSIWRFIPNHGRRHAKETQLLEDDLNALRNQHNLLCVLYYTSPATLRLPVSHLRNLVDVKTSHSEVIRINIRSWTNLVRYQLSCGEEASSLDQFSRWYNDLVHDLIDLHRHARIEAEAAVSAAAKASGGPSLTPDVVESVIANNERQVEGLLTMTLASLNDLMAHCESPAMMQQLFERCDVAASLALFDPKKPRLFKQVTLALDACQTYFRSRTTIPTASAQADDNDDSQDFGDWSDVEALAEVGPESLQKLDVAVKTVQSLVSNCMGADAFFDEPLLTRATDAWVSACHSLVKLKQRSWNYFLDPHSNDSWSQFRDTDQARTYGTSFVAKVISIDKSAWNENTAIIIAIWMKSLVERESILKFQHLLTTTLLNVDPTNMLLSNLPFTKGLDTAPYSVSLQELRARRLSIISTVLANIRRAIEADDLDLADTTEKLRQDYAQILKALMDEMKRIFQDMQQSSSVRGSYVDFVQQVVEYLQQYTAEIMPIDKFFTDSGVFPLPAKDPTYVIGRLKRFVPSISDERSQKKLAIFLQAVCERAACDNQQAYLTEQLSASVTGSWEDMRDDRLSLRRVLLEALLPVYISSIFSQDCAWILALPMIEACGIMFEDLAFAFNIVDIKIASSVSRVAIALLRPMREVVARVAANTSLLFQAHVSSILSVIFRATTSMLPLAEYTERLTTATGVTTNCLLYIHAFGTMLLRMSQDQEPNFDGSRLAEPVSSMDVSLRNITSFCESELTESLSKNWTRHGDEYFITRGRERREVIVDLATPEKELEDLVGEVEGFMAVWKRMPALRELC